MSIRETILTLEAAGKVTRYEPRTRGGAKRRIFLTKSVMDELTIPGSAINLLGLGGFIHAALTRWAAGDLVFASDKGRPGFLKRLRAPPAEIWEVRITEPDKQVRLFGRFAEPDTLVITHVHTRDQLRRKKSRAWASAMNDCEQEWNALFPGLAPFSGNTVHDYVTENCDDFSLSS